MSSNRHLELGAALRGARVTLRQPTRDELVFVRSLWTDPETMEAVGGIVAYSPERMDQWFEYMVDPGGVKNCYCLIFAADGEPVGEVSFHGFDPEARTAELNIKVMARHRGRGLGGDSLAAFLDFYFNAVKGERITDAIRPGNSGAEKLLTHAGFKRGAVHADRIDYQLSRARFLA